MLTDMQDAHGHSFLDHLNGQDSFEVIERDDGYVESSNLSLLYFSNFEEWRDREQKAMEYVNGKVLDIGAGAGRHSLYLQNNGYDVLAIDNSPLAIEVCRKRGIKNAMVLSATEINKNLGIFDTILMMGNNFGLFANAKRTKWLLKRMHSITSKNARIIAESRDVYVTTRQEHLDYQARNRKRGRMSGQVKIRIRYKKYCSPWFDYLMVSKTELEELIKGTGWQVEKYLDHLDGIYIMILKKEK